MRRHHKPELGGGDAGTSGETGSEIEIGVDSAVDDDAASSEVLANSHSGLELATG